MRHEHLVVTVESGTKARIEDDLDPGETVEAWIADAIDEKLADDGSADRETNDDPTQGDDGTSATDDRTAGTDDRTAEADEYEDGDDYDEGFEYVDDCSI